MRATLPGVVMVSTWRVTARASNSGDAWGRGRDSVRLDFESVELEAALDALAAFADEIKVLPSSGNSFSGDVELRHSARAQPPEGSDPRVPLHHDNPPELRVRTAQDRTIEAVQATFRAFPILARAYAEAQHGAPAAREDEPEPDPEWRGQRYYVPHGRGRREVKALRRTDFAIAHRVGDRITSANVVYAVDALEDDGDTVVLRRARRA